MNIIYIAYSCSPNHGSEDRIGWKLPLESSKSNNVIVITKVEHRNVIEEYISDHKDLKIEFHYVDIPGIYKKVYKGAAYSGRLKAWQKRALEAVERICSERSIDIIHQITPVEFRSVGDYGRIDGVKYVCGPLGGGEYILDGLASYAGRHVIEEALRRFLNHRSLRAIGRKGILHRCDALFFSNKETEEYLSSLHDGGILMNEIGIDDAEIDRSRKSEGTDSFTILMAGRLNYRKGHRFLLDALAALPADLKWECIVVGNGPELKGVRKRCRRLSLEGKVLFKGRVAFDEMCDIYSSADVLVMPSLRETTGSVLLEAMAKGLPVITVDAFGGAVLTDDSCGWLYSSESKEGYIRELSSILEKCIRHPEQVAEKANGAIIRAGRVTWNRKMEYYNSVYKKLVDNGR